MRQRSYSIADSFQTGLNKPIRSGRVTGGRSIRTCMFCGSKVSSKEYAWPQRLMKRFPGVPTGRIYAERSGQDLGNWPTATKNLQLSGSAAPVTTAG
jgi:hypothetical protein